MNEWEKIVDRLELYGSQKEYLEKLVYKYPIGETETRVLFDSVINENEPFGEGYLIKVNKKNPFIRENMNKKEFEISEYFKKYRSDLYKWINPVIHSILDSSIIYQKRCEPLYSFSDIPIKIPVQFEMARPSDFVWLDGVAVLNHYSFIELNEINKNSVEFINREKISDYQSIFSNPKINMRALKKALKTPHII